MSGKLIRKITSVQPLSPESEQRLLDRITLSHLERNDRLLDEGKVCKAVYYLESGCVRSVMNVEGNEINLNFALDDSFTTNLKSLRNETPSEYTIQACEPSVIWRFDKNSLFELYNESPEIAGFGRNLLEQLLVEQEEHANLFKIKSPAERYRHILESNPLLLQKITLTQMASYIGISRETLSRIRKSK